jgi:hypothetical protein
MADSKTVAATSRRPAFHKAVFINTIHYTESRNYELPIANLLLKTIRHLRFLPPAPLGKIHHCLLGLQLAKLGAKRIPPFL